MITQAYFAVVSTSVQNDRFLITSSQIRLLPFPATKKSEFALMLNGKGSHPGKVSTLSIGWENVWENVNIVTKAGSALKMNSCREISFGIIPETLQ